MSNVDRSAASPTRAGRGTHGPISPLSILLGPSAAASDRNITITLCKVGMSDDTMTLGAALAIEGRQSVSSPRADVKKQLIYVRLFGLSRAALAI
jgi:hypothetical protein